MPTDFEKIYINEIFPNPLGIDLGSEWIELYNSSEKAINISNYEFQNAGTNFIKTFSITEEIYIEPNSYFLICEKNILNCDFYVEKIGMQNGGDATDGIMLLNSDKSIVDILLYDLPNKNSLKYDFVNVANEIHIFPSIKEEQSISRISYNSSILADNFTLTNTPTPGNSNFPEMTTFISEYSAFSNFIEIINDPKDLNKKIFIDIEDGLTEITVDTYPIQIVNLPTIISSTETKCIKVKDSNNRILDEVCPKSISTNYSNCRIFSDQSNPAEVKNLSFNNCEITKSAANHLFLPVNFFKVIDINKSENINSYILTKACIKNLKFNNLKIIYDDTGGALVSNKESLQEGCFNIEIHKSHTDMSINYIFNPINIESQPLNTPVEWSYVNLKCNLVSTDNENNTVTLLCGNNYLFTNRNEALKGEEKSITGFLLPYSKTPDSTNKLWFEIEKIESLAQSNNETEYLAKSGDNILIAYTFSTLFIILLLSVKLKDLIKFYYFKK